VRTMAAALRNISRHGPRLGGLALVLGLIFSGQPSPAQDLGRSGMQDVESSFDQAASLSGPQKLERASQLLEEMKTLQQRGLDSLTVAREEKDLIKMNCVNEKLTSQKGLLKISEQALVQLQDAISLNDTQAANHEYTKIAIAYQKMRGLGIEIGGCAGEALRYSGETDVEVEISGDITKDDPTTRPLDDPVLDHHPEASSPFE